MCSTSDAEIRVDRATNFRLHSSSQRSTFIQRIIDAIIEDRLSVSSYKGLLMMITVRTYTNLSYSKRTDSIDDQMLLSSLSKK